MIIYILLCYGLWFQPTPLKNDGVKVTWDDEIPNIWKNQNVPNHQPDHVWCVFFQFDGTMVRYRMIFWQSWWNARWDFWGIPHYTALFSDNPHSLDGSKSGGQQGDWMVKRSLLRSKKGFNMSKIWLQIRRGILNNFANPQGRWRQTPGLPQ